MTHTRTISILYTGITAPDVLKHQPSHQNIALTHLPMLESRPIEFDRAHVRSLLQKPAAIVFYSQIAVGYMLDQGIFDDIDLTDKTFWAVGQKTARLLERELQVSVQVPAEENYEGLKIAFEEAFQSSPPPPTLLALSLQGVHRDFSEICARRGIAFEDVSVYETSATGADRLAQTLTNSSFDWIVFTSPRGVQTFFEHLNTIENADSLPTNWRLAAIGPSTEKAIKIAGYTAHITVPAPDRNLIIDAIVEYS